METRSVFWDNMRLFLVLCVVVEHSSHAYTQMIWWPVSDFAKSNPAAWLSSFSDAFAMPLLFFIAGYFAIPSILKKGAAAFMVGKLRRLGIPWLVCILTVCPIVPMVYQYTRNNQSLSMSYWELWRTLMQNALNFDVGIIYSMNDLMHNLQFYQRYMWFLSLLVLFFSIFGAVYSIKKSWLKPVSKFEPSKAPTVMSTLKILISVGALTVLGSFSTVGALFALAPELSNPEPLFTLGNIIQFRPSRLFFYIVYFVFGVLTFKYKWIERGKFPGHMPTWLIAFVLVVIGFYYARHQMVNGPEELEEIYGATYFFALNFLTITTLGLFTSLVIKYWNRPTAFNQRLAANSYHIYLAHYLFVIVFQLALSAVAGLPGFVKFGFVSGLSILCSYLVSQFVIRPYPRVAAAMAFGLFMVMVLVIK